MKKFLSFLIIMLAAVISYGQTAAPGIFNYQGVARNSVGNALVNKTINLRLTIHDGAAAGPVVYQESRLAATNPFGLFNVQVGSPGFLTQVGLVSNVNWGVNTKFIQVEIDPNGGTSFINVGTAQIASVPYSLYSSLANDLVLPFNKTQADAGTLFRIVNSGTGSGSTALEGQTNSTAGNAYAVIGRVNSPSPGGFSTGVRGINLGTGGLGIGVWGSQEGSGWGVYGTAPAGIGVNGSSNTGIGVQGVSTSGTGGRFSTTSGLALHTTGGLRLQGILEGPPIAPNTFKLLAGDPLGNATWQHASAIGLISGSGTLNFVPKWTPNGTTLGNSQIFDDGTFVGVGTITPFSKLTVVQNNSGVNLGGGPNTGSEIKFLNFGTSHMSIYNRGNNALTFAQTSALSQTDVLGSPLMTLTSGGNLGIGTVTPTARLSVNELFKVLNSGTVQYANGVNPMMIMFESGTSNPDRMVIGHSPAFPTWGLQYQDAPDKFNFLSGGTSVLTADLGNQRVGIGTISPSTKLQVIGSVNITDGTQGINRLFFDNGAGLGTGEWRTPAGAGLVSGSGTLNYIPKWTPDGVTLGNSQMFDNGTNIGLATTTPLGKFHNLSGAAFLNTNMEGSSAAGTWLSLGNTSAGGRWYNIVSTGAGNGEGPGKLVFFQAGAANLATGSIMTMVHSSMNVGVNTNNPIYKFHVNSGNSFGTQILEAQDANNAGPHLAFLSGGEVGFLDYIRSDYTVGGLAHRQGSLELRGNSRLNFYPTSLVGSADLAMTVIGNGYVGIGTITPTENLHLTGRMQIDRSPVTVLPAATWVDEDLRINSVDAQLALYSLQSGLSSGAISFKEVDGAGNLNDQWAMQRRTTGAFDIGYGTGFDPGTTTTLLRLLTNGNLGLGTTAPVTRFHVAGQATIEDGTEGVGRIFTDNGAGVGTGEWRTPAGAGLVSGSGTLNYVPKWTPNGTTLGNSQIFDNGFAVGIGTATPGFKVHIADNSPELLVQDVNDNTSISLIPRGAGYTGGVGTRGNDDLPLFTNNLDRVTVKATTGYVGVGTSVPSAFTEITGNSVVGTPHLKVTETDNDYGRLTFRNVHAGNAGNNFWDIAGYNNDTRANERLNFYNASTGDLMSITGDGRVGIGTFNPFVKFHVNSGTDFGTVLLDAQSAQNAGPHQYFYSGGELATINYIRTDYTVAAEAYRRGALEVRGNTRLNLLPTTSVDLVNGMTIRSNGFVGIGTASPVYKMHLASTVAVELLQDTDDGSAFAIAAPGAGYTGGVGTFSNHDLAIFSNNTDRVTVKNTGLVGVNTFTPVARLHSVELDNIGTQSDVSFTVFNAALRRAANQYQSLNSSFGIFSKQGAVINSNRPVALESAILGMDSSASNFTAGVIGYGIGNQDIRSGVFGFSAQSAAPTGTAGFSGFNGGTFWGGDNGISAGVWNSLPQLQMNGTEPNKYAVQAFVETVPHPGTNVGLYVLGVSGGATNYGAFINGDVQVNGNFSATGAKAFRIDHPLDPENKYLSHFAVESPEVQNVYNGNIETDANGKAIVELPGYFDAINKDFKYQLTIVDETQFAMARVSKKIKGNSFEIMTSVPGIEVSWQVTAVRNDKTVQQLAVAAETNKPANEKGKFLNPELYGQSANKALFSDKSGKGRPVISSNQGSADKTVDIPVNTSLPQPKKFPVEENTLSAEQQRAGISAQQELMKGWAKPIEKPQGTGSVPALGKPGKPSAPAEKIIPKGPGAATIQNGKATVQPVAGNTVVPSARLQEYKTKTDQVKNAAEQKSKAVKEVQTPVMPDPKQTGIEKAPPQPLTKPEPVKSQKAPEAEKDPLQVKPVTAVSRTE